MQRSHIKTKTLPARCWQRISKENPFVYGLDLPEIRRVLPTNIPTVKANELRLDNLFELADGTAALVDYESIYHIEKKELRTKLVAAPLRSISFYSRKQ